MEFLKVHGSNNDFFILDEELPGQKISDQKLRQLAQKICDRQTGLHGGADGILDITAGHADTQGRMRVINADGSEASMCGNGLRTVARYLAQKKAQDEFKIQTMYADLDVKAAGEFYPGVPAYDAEISPVSFKAEDLGMHVGHEELFDQIVPEFDSELHFSAVAVPNPHLIAFVDHKTVIGDKLGELASYLNDGQNPYFPDGVNVSFVEVLAPGKIFVRTYERGVGYTNACGTAMSASSLMYVLLFGEQVQLEERITVLNPGGMVNTIVHQKENGTYYMSLIGNATEVAQVEVNLAAALAGDFSQAKWKATGEQAQYEAFVKEVTEG